MTDVLECIGMFSCTQSSDLLTINLFLSLIIGVFTSLFIWKVVEWLRWRSTNVNIESECASESCVRCHQKTSTQKTALERFSEVENSLINDVSPRIKSAILNHDIQELPIDQKPNVLFIPNLTTNNFFDKYHSDTTVLKNIFPQIKEEFINIFHHHLDKWTTNTTPTGEWSVFYLRNQGLLIKSNCNLCPNTFKAISSLKNSITNCVFGNAAFSVLQPGTHIEKHYGPTNARIRCHLGLITPPEASLIVNHESISWQSGECFLFDDSFLHSAQHVGSKSAGIRVIFMVDLWNPSLTLSERKIIEKCYGSKNS